MNKQKLLARARKEGECMFWLGALNAYGYGAVRYQGKVIGAHRLSYILHHGEIPDGELVMHSCDNRPCINPAHLSLGSIADNIQDMWDKGRDHQSKLTAEQVESIRSRYIPRHPQHGARAMAREFGVTHQAISHAVLGKTWAGNG